MSAASSEFHLVRREGRPRRGAGCDHSRSTGRGPCWRSRSQECGGRAGRTRPIRRAQSQPPLPSVPSVPRGHGRGRGRRARRGCFIPWVWGWPSLPRVPSIPFLLAPLVVTLVVGRRCPWCLIPLHISGLYCFTFRTILGILKQPCRAPFSSKVSFHPLLFSQRPAYPRATTMSTELLRRPRTRHKDTVPPKANRSSRAWRAIIGTFTVTCTAIFSRRLLGLRTWLSFTCGGRCFIKHRCFRQRISTHSDLEFIAIVRCRTEDCFAIQLLDVCRLKQGWLHFVHSW